MLHNKTEAEDDHSTSQVKCSQRTIMQL